LKKHSIVMVLAFCLMLPFMALAQDDASSPLLDMLALVPDNPQARGGILSYVDYRAVESTRPGAAQPQSWAEWNALQEAQDPSAGLWMAAFFGVSSGPPNFISYLSQFGPMPQLVGFDWFDINRALIYGEPPSTGTVLAGDFDVDAIVAAYQRRGFEQSELNGLPLLCSPTGCDDGLRLDLQNVDPANPFGGQFGRKEPLLIAPGYLMDSPDYEQVQAMADAYRDDEDSLADAPDFRAAAGIASANGTLVQIQFVNFALLSVPFFSDNPDEIAKEAGVLPLYQLAAFAHRVEGEDQIAEIILIYGNEANAQDAAVTLQDRISKYTSMAIQQPLVDILEERGITLVEPQVVQDEDTGKWATVIAFTSPVPGPEQNESDQLVQSGLNYRLLINMLYQRDLAWLTPFQPN
jgi:hypothetical protein